MREYFLHVVLKSADIRPASIPPLPIAKLIMPGRDGGGFFLTCILGIVGAVVGGWLATMFGIGGSISGFNLHSFLVAVVGAILVLGVFRLLRRE